MSSLPHHLVRRGVDASLELYSAFRQEESDFTLIISGGAMATVLATLFAYLLALVAVRSAPSPHPVVPP